MKARELPGIRETTEDFDGIEREIMKVFRREIYGPLVRELGLPRSTVQNADPFDRLHEAIQTGRIRYSRGRFHGKLDAGLTKALRAIGAKWDRKTESFHLPAGKLPDAIRGAVAVSEGRFLKAMAAIDRKLAAILPKQVAENVQMAKFFDRTLYRIDSDFEKQMKAITVTPKLTPEVRAAVAEGYTKDLRRYIEDFTQKEITALRRKISESAISGTRYESLARTIEESYGVSQNKAKFLARQETALMMASFKSARYQDAGIKEYRWQCVVGSPKHPVRAMHKALEGKVFRWDQPPVTDNKGNRNNPGEDYNCRCIARPIVKF